MCSAKSLAGNSSQGVSIVRLLMSRAAARQILDTLYILPNAHIPLPPFLLTLVYDTVHVTIGIKSVTVSKSGVGAWTFDLDPKTKTLLPLDLHELVQLVRELRYNLWGSYEKKQDKEKDDWSSSSVYDYSSIVSD